MGNELPPKPSLVIVRPMEYHPPPIPPIHAHPIDPPVTIIRRKSVGITILVQALLVIFLNFAIPKTISLMFDFMDAPLGKEGREFLVVVTLIMNIMIIPMVMGISIALRHEQ